MYVIDQCKQLTRLAILTRDDGGKTRKGTQQEDGHDIREREGGDLSQNAPSGAGESS